MEKQFEGVLRAVISRVHKNTGDVVTNIQLEIAGTIDLSEYVQIPLEIILRREK